MREIEVEEISKNVAKLCITASQVFSKDVKVAFSKAYDQETSDLGKEIISQLIENSQIAQRKKIPICQDTGLCVVFVEIGQDVHIKGGLLGEAIQKGVAEGYTQGYLRKSIVSDPVFERKNTQNNTPAVIHYDIVGGENLKITVAPKGFGSENKSALCMLTPAQGLSGIKDFFIQTLKNAGPNSCPPLLVGVGIGGSMEKCAILSKKAAIREIGSCNPHPQYAQLENELLHIANDLGIGPQGLGGKVTAFGVNIEWYPTHIAGLPVAININCNAIRHKSIVL